MEHKSNNAKSIRKKPLSTIHIIYQNLRKRLVRSSLLLVIVLLLAFTIVTSSLLLESLKLGMISTSDRMGADIIIVPRHYVSSIQDALFLGKPCTVYFHKSWINKIEKIKGVKRVSYQMYLATLSESDCCDSAIQIIAFDPSSDFVINPWLKRTVETSLEGNQIIIGNHLNYNPGDIAKFYGEEFIVAAKLDKTGMGYDNTVFLSYDTALDLARKPVVRNNFSIGDSDNMISMITVEIEEGYGITEVRDSITGLYGTEEITIYESNSLLIGLSKNLNQYTAYSNILNALLLLSTIFSLVCIFGITINERRREFGILRSIGANKIRILKIIVGEAVIISTVGCIFGALLAGILIFSFQNYITGLLKVPFLLPQWNTVLLIAGKALGISLISGILSSLYAAFKISFTDIYDLIRSNEA